MAERIVFVGDSVTEAGKTAQNVLGDGYVAMLASRLACVDPEAQVFNAGIGGNTVRDLDSRWTRDVLDRLPTTLSILIGVNDVWRKVEGLVGQAVPVEEFELILSELIHRTRERQAPRIVLMEPFLVEPNQDDPFRIELAGHQAVVRRLAAELELPLVPLQDAFDDAMATTDPKILAGDRVHPTPAGHALIADAAFPVVAPRSARAG